MTPLNRSLSLWGAKAASSANLRRGTGDKECSHWVTCHSKPQQRTLITRETGWFKCLRQEWLGCGSVLTLKLTLITILLHFQKALIVCLMFAFPVRMLWWRWHLKQVLNKTFFYRMIHVVIDKSFAIPCLILKWFDQKQCKDYMTYDSIEYKNLHWTTSNLYLNGWLLVQFRNNKTSINEEAKNPGKWTIWRMLNSRAWERQVSLWRSLSGMCTEEKQEDEED